MPALAEFPPEYERCEAIGSDSPDQGVVAKTSLKALPEPPTAPSGPVGSTGLPGPFAPHPAPTAEKSPGQRQRAITAKDAESSGHATLLIRSCRPIAESVILAHLPRLGRNSLRRISSGP